MHKRIVSEMTGSLPMGGVVLDTPIYGVTPTPEYLLLQDATIPAAQRVDVDVGGKLAFVIHHVVTVDDARRMIALTEQLGYRDEAPGIQTPPGMRMNKTVHWVSDEAFLRPMFARIGHLLPRVIDGKALFDGFSHRINMYKYDVGDVFNKHIDGGWPGYGMDERNERMVQWRGVHSQLTMLLYLNDPSDGVVGGDTVLYDDYGKTVTVTPQTGSALFFRHGHSLASVAHVGAKVLGATPKYVARINVLYEE